MDENKVSTIERLKFGFKNASATRKGISILILSWPTIATIFGVGNWSGFGALIVGTMVFSIPVYFIIRNVFDKDGFNVYGLTKNGFNRNSIHKDTNTKLDPDGFDINGLDVEGYDSRGYDKEGYDSNGFNKSGWSRDKTNKETNTLYDSEGFNIDGFDKDGNPPRPKKGYEDKCLRGLFETEPFKVKGSSPNNFMLEFERVKFEKIKALKSTQGRIRALLMYNWTKNENDAMKLGQTLHLNDCKTEDIEKLITVLEEMREFTFNSKEYAQAFKEKKNNLFSFGLTEHEKVYGAVDLMVKNLSYVINNEEKVAKYTAKEEKIRLKDIEDEGKKAAKKAKNAAKKAYKNSPEGQKQEILRRIEHNNNMIASASEGIKNDQMFGKDPSHKHANIAIWRAEISTLKSKLSVL